MKSVSVGCLCPPDQTRHPEGDTINFHDPLPFTKAIVMQKAVGIMVADSQEAEAEEILATLTEAYVLYGIESWTLEWRDAKGKVQPVPVSAATIREHLLTRLDDAMTVADAADDLYAPVVLRPLVQRGWKSSPLTPTDDSTSPPNGSEDVPPKPSKRSLTTTTQTDDTETTSLSLVGGSKSSQNSASVA